MPMSFEEEQRRVLGEIEGLIKSSPATAKTSADNLNIPKDIPQASGVTEAVLDMLQAQKANAQEPEIPEIGLGSTLAVGSIADSSTLEKLAMASQPIDRSVGVNIPAVDTATQKIATNRTIGITGAGDYVQATYGLDDSRGAASSGANEGDLYVENLRAGNAGLNIATGSTLNPYDGSDGNPAFFSTRYPLLQTTVAPFKVRIPRYNMEVTSETMDPEKLAYQVATIIGGRPVPTYIGYTNAGFDITEPWYSGLMKGMVNAPANLADMVVKGTGFAASTAMTYKTTFDTMLQGYLFGDSPKDIEKKIVQRVSEINAATDLSAEDWNKLIAAYKDKHGTELTEFAGFGTQFAEQAPTVFAQIGAIYGLSVLNAAQGLSPAVSSMLIGSIFGAAQGGEEFVALKDAAISPMNRVSRATAGAAASMALNSLGAWGMFGSKVSAARQYVTNYAKRLGIAGLQGVGGAALEGVTELGDQILQDYVTYNMGDDNYANRLDSYAMAFLLGAVGGMLSIPAHISAEQRQIVKEQVLAQKVTEDASDLVKELRAGVDALANVGFTREQAWDVIAGMASPEGQEYFRKKQQETAMGMLDRLSPEAIQYAKDLGAKQSERFMNDLNEIDQTVYKSLPANLDDSTKTMVSRAMQGIASVVTYYGGDFKMPKFRVRDGSPMAYDEKSNTIYVNTKSTGESVDLGMVQDRNLQLLDPVQRGILHELGHMMDIQLGKGTNYKEFMPTYFEAIAKVFGKDKANNIQKQLNKTGDRFTVAKDSQEKQKNATGEISENNTTEYFAYAIGRLGKKVGRVLGMADSDVAQHIDAINVMASTLKVPSIQKQLSAYQKAMAQLVSKNDKTLQAMAKAQGNEELARKIQDFVAGDDTALSKEDVLALYNILKTYTGVDGAKILDEAFANTKQESFMERTEREFADSIKESGMTVGQLQDKINSENVKAMKDSKQDKIGEDDLPTFFDEKLMGETTFDVSKILGEQKKPFVSNLEKRANAKPDGLNYAEDIKEVSGIISKAGKTPKWFAKFFANGDLNMGLWSIGGKKLVDHFDLIGRMNRSSDASMDYLAKFDTKLKKTMGFKNNVQRDAFENNAAVNSIDVDYAIDPLTDEAISTKISPLVAMNLYNNAKSTVGYQKVLRAFGGDERGMNKVLNSLTPEQKKYADAMMDYLKENWGYYKKSYEQEGITLDDEPYWPIADAVHIALGDRKINSDFARKHDTSGAISLDVDAREVFNHYIQRMAGAQENVYATIQRMKDIFGYEKQSSDDHPTEDYLKLSDEMWKNSKKIRGMARSNIGDDAKYDRFLSLMDDFLAKREASLVGAESLNIAARNLTSGLLQWKPIQFMKNLANAAGYWGLANNQVQYWSDTAWAATHPIEAAKYMFEKVPYIRNRFRGQNIDEALTQQTAGTDSLLMNWAKDTTHLSKDGQQIVSNLVALTQASRRLGFTPMLSGDMAANVIGGYGLLKQYEAQYGDKAGDKLSEAIVMHQASSNQATRSLLQRQWSRDIRGELLRFSSEGVQKGKSIGLAIAQAARGERTAGNAAKEILSTMSSMVLFALVSAGVIDLFDGDDENDEKVYEALTREGVSAIAGFSVIGNSVIAPIVSIPLTGEMSTIGTPLTNIVSADLKKLNKGDWENLVVHGISSTVPVVGMDNLINLGKGGVRQFDEDERVRKAGRYQIMGRSENYGEQRAGLK